MSPVIYDERAIKLYKQTGIKIPTATVASLAKKIYFNNLVDRAPWIGKLVKIDNKLGICGFELIFDKTGFYFSYLCEYIDLYKPIRQIYADLCLTLYPEFFAENIKDNAYAHLTEAIYLYIERNNERISRKIPLGNMLNNSVLINSMNYEMIDSIYKLMSYEPKYEFFGKSFYTEAPEPDFFSTRGPEHDIAESLMVYFICRVAVHRLLTECGLIQNIVAESEKKRFIGQFRFFPDVIATKSS